MVCLQLGRGLDHLAALSQACGTIIDELVDNLLGALELVDDGGALAHQERPELVHEVINVNILLGLDVGLLVILALGLAAGNVKVGALLAAHDLVKVGLVGEDSLGGQLLDLVLAVILPVKDVGVLLHAQGTAREDDGLDGIVVAGGADSLLV